MVAVVRLFAFLLCLLSTWFFILSPILTFHNLFQAAIPLFSMKAQTVYVPVYLVVALGVYLDLRLLRLLY